MSRASKATTALKRKSAVGVVAEAGEPIDRRRTNMREQIVEAAAELFFTHGFEGTTIGMITKACGITPGALYNHFPGKEDLLFELVRGGIAEIEQDMCRAVESHTDPRKQLVALVSAFVRFHAEHQLGALVATADYRFLPEPRLSEARALRLRLRGIFERVIEAGIETGQFRLAKRKGIGAARLAAIAIGDMCIRVAEWFEPHGPISAQEIGVRYADLSLGLVRGHTD
jgi:AcrR family transcriptional regulator